MSERLIATLALAGVEALRPQVGVSTIALLDRMGSSANSPRGLAELVVSRTGAAGALRSKEVRALALTALEHGEKEEICRLLGYPTGDVGRTLRGAPFDKAESQLELLFGWFAVPFETDEQADEEGTRHVPPSHKLRDHQRPAYRELRGRLGGERGGAALLQMPMGSGKLRIAATALADLFRSEPDGRVILWLAHDPLLCEQAYDELEYAWRMLGSQDVTLYRHYGRHHTRDLNEVEGGMIVADVQLLTQRTDDVELGALGRRTCAVVVADAHQADAIPYRRALRALGTARTFALIGLSARPDAKGHPDDQSDPIRTLFPDDRIGLSGRDPVARLQAEGVLSNIAAETMWSGTGVPSSLAPDDLDYGEAALSALADDLDRNVLLLERLQAEVRAGESVVFFATTGEQAKTFVGLLALHGIHAVAVTAEMSRERRQQAMQQYQNRDHARVLCAHGILVSGSMVPKTTMALVARPTTSPMLYSLMIGRLASGPAEEGPGVLRVIALIDDVPGFAEVVARSLEWEHT